jgi:hypothetical protein
MEVCRRSEELLSWGSMPLQRSGKRTSTPGADRRGDPRAARLHRSRRRGRCLPASFRPRRFTRPRRFAPSLTVPGLPGWRSWGLCLSGESRHVGPIASPRQAAPPGLGIPQPPQRRGRPPTSGDDTSEAQHCRASTASAALGPPKRTERRMLCRPPGGCPADHRTRGSGSPGARPTPAEAEVKRTPRQLPTPPKRGRTDGEAEATPRREGHRGDRPLPPESTVAARFRFPVRGGSCPSQASRACFDTAEAEPGVCPRLFSLVGPRILVTGGTRNAASCAGGHPLPGLSPGSPQDEPARRLDGPYGPVTIPTCQ